MLNIFKKKSRHQKLQEFMKREKERRKEAEGFISFAAQLIGFVAEDVWGQNEILVIGPKMTFKDGEFLSATVHSPKTEKQAASQEAALGPEKVSEPSQVSVLSLKGKEFWESVQDISAYLEEMMEDIQKREEGRSQVLQDIRLLTNKIGRNPIFHVTGKILNL